MAPIATQRARKAHNRTSIFFCLICFLSAALLAILQKTFSFKNRKEDQTWPRMSEIWSAPKSGVIKLFEKSPKRWLRFRMVNAFVFRNALVNILHANWKLNCFRIIIAGLGEFKIRDLNDEINKLLREKDQWETRIKELHGPDYKVI